MPFGPARPLSLGPPGRGVLSQNKATEMARDWHAKRPRRKRVRQPFPDPVIEDTPPLRHNRYRPCILWARGEAWRFWDLIGLPKLERAMTRLSLIFDIHNGDYD